MSAEREAAQLRAVYADYKRRHKPTRVVWLKLRDATKRALLAGKRRRK